MSLPIDWSKVPTLDLNAITPQEWAAVPAAMPQPLYYQIGDGMGIWPAGADAHMKLVNPDGSIEKVVINRDLSRWTPDHGLDAWDGEVRYRCMAVAVRDGKVLTRPPTMYNEMAFFCGKCAGKLPTPELIRAPGDVCPECFSVAVSADRGFAFHRDAFLLAWDAIQMAPKAPWVGPVPTLTQEESDALNPPKP